MDSVISQEQLNILLASSRDSVSIDKVIHSISKTHRLDSMEKQAIYHNILEIVNNSTPPEIASYILEQIQYFLDKKGNALAELIDNSYHQSLEPATSEPRKISPLFRRVG